MLRRGAGRTIPLVATPAGKRQAVAHLVAGHGMSERRACRVIGCCRMTMRYEAIRQDDPALRERLKELARVRRRFGYRRLHVFLRREGHEVNHKRLFIKRAEVLHFLGPPGTGKSHLATAIGVAAVKAGRSVYHRRSRAESKLHCIKRPGQCLSARDFDRQFAEFHVRVAVLNGFTARGIPVTEAVG
jgi:ABC-type glutathione transport system ATPase component